MTAALDAIRARLTRDLGAALETWANETGEDGYPDPDFLVAEMPDFLAALDRAEAVVARLIGIIHDTGRSLEAEGYDTPHQGFMVECPACAALAYQVTSK